MDFPIALAEAGRAWLTERSPLSRANAIKKPLLIGQGANDPRVKQDESDQIVKAIRERGATAWHLVGTNEGHGFAKKENADYQFWTSLIFWQQNLLGK